MLLGLPDPDGGLYVPVGWPDLREASAGAAGYPDLVARIAAPFLPGVASADDLYRAAAGAYEEFTTPEVVPMIEFEDGLFLMQLFWGPTLAFKDLALQFLAGVIEAAAVETDHPILVLGATSGDTGAAAIEAFRGRAGIRVAILHPHGMVTDVQRRFMTTTGDANVTNLAVEGTFDDCQAILKRLLSQPDQFAPARLASANSIGFLRVVGQVAYYAAASKELGAARFSVPTGNFGNAYSAYVAKRCGLPVTQILTANNPNRAVSDLLAGAWTTRPVEATLSPAMDIRLPSNFERAVFEAFDRDVDRVRGWIGSDELALPDEATQRLRADFVPAWVSEEKTLSTIGNHYRRHGSLIDPHTAVAVAAALEAESSDEPTVVLATAHPAKFPEAVSRATGTVPALPERFERLLGRAEQYDVVPADADRVGDLLRRRLESDA